MNYSETIINCEASVCDAMRIIDRNDLHILFISDRGKLLGTLTDGDIRRYLFNGGKIEDLAERAANHNPRVAYDVCHAAELYDRTDFIAIPLVDKNGYIIDIYVGDEMRREKAVPQLGIPVVINAGGKGTRLDPFTRVLPKPLIPIGDLPIIEHIMQRFKKYGCNEFSVIVNYKKELIKTYFRESENQYSISWYDEEKPLGTGGGLSLLKGKQDQTFIFTNCDILLQSDYESMIRFHKESGNIITMVCAWKNLSIPYGVVDMGMNGQIEKMREKPELSFLTNTGMYIVEPEVLEDIPDDVPITFPEIILGQKEKGRRTAVYPVNESEWLDMGQIPELEKMRERFCK
ncbi:MAG: sugar phosphate nucleotidyltransferase [Eubacteriales bacterium]|nr:sugar phosphate nucleotidyltransferase [Eubacteriales bacterium]